MTKIGRIALLFIVSTGFVCPSLAANPSGTSRISKKEAPKKVASKKWALEGYLLHVNPQVEDNKDSMLLGLGAGYELSKTVDSSSSVGTTLDYRHVLTEYRDEKNSFIEEVEFNYNQIFTPAKDINLSWSALGNIPSNEAHQKAGYNFSLGAKGGVSYKIQRITVGASLTPKYHNYSYETGNAAGTIKNSKYSLISRLDLSLAITQSFTASVSSMLLESWTYTGSKEQAYYTIGMLNFGLTKNLSLMAGVASSDQLETHREYFAESVTTYRAGLSWNL